MGISVGWSTNAVAEVPLSPPPYVVHTHATTAPHATRVKSARFLSTSLAAASGAACCAACRTPKRVAHSFVDTACFFRSEEDGVDHAHDTSRARRDNKKTALSAVTHLLLLVGRRGGLAGAVAVGRGGDGRVRGLRLGDDPRPRLRPDGGEAWRRGGRCDRRLVSPAAAVP